MNKKGQAEWGLIVVYIFLAFFFAALIPSMIFDVQCKGVTQERDAFQIDRDYWKNQTFALNDSVNRCSQLIQAERNICDDRINNATQTCEETNDLYLGIILDLKTLTIIYSFTLTIWLTLTFSLFKSLFKFKILLSEENNAKIKDFIEHHQRLIKSLKVTAWVLWAILLLYNIVACVTFLSIKG